MVINIHFSGLADAKTVGYYGSRKEGQLTAITQYQPKGVRIALVINLSQIHLFAKILQIKY